MSTTDEPVTSYPISPEGDFICVPVSEHPEALEAQTVIAGAYPEDETVFALTVDSVWMRCSALDDSDALDFAEEYGASEVWESCEPDADGAQMFWMVCLSADTALDIINDLRERLVVAEDALLAIAEEAKDLQEAKSIADEILVKIEQDPDEV